MQNAVQAGASAIVVTIDEDGARTRVVVEDDGAGMDEETHRHALDPFYSDGVKHPERRVGLGLPFVRQAAEATDGRFLLWSEPGRGTRIEVELPAKHPDVPPFSDPAGCFAVLVGFEGDHELVIKRYRADGSYSLRRSELLEALGEMESVDSRVLLREYIGSLEGSTK